MKNFFSRILLLIVAVSSISVTDANTLVILDDNKLPTHYTPIVVRKKNTTTDIHRGLVCPIDAYYQDHTVYFTFADNLGELYIEITHTGNGATICESVDSGVLTTYIDVTSLGSGSHHIHIETSYGDTYYGEYNL